jgi:hypothetical protein
MNLNLNEGGPKEEGARRTGSGGQSEACGWSGRMHCCRLKLPYREPHTVHGQAIELAAEIEFCINVLLNLKRE